MLVKLTKKEQKEYGVLSEIKQGGFMIRKQEERKSLMLQSIIISELLLKNLLDLEKYGMIKGKMKLQIKSLKRKLQEDLVRADNVFDNDVDALEDLKIFKDFVIKKINSLFN